MLKIQIFGERLSSVTAIPTKEQDFLPRSITDLLFKNENFNQRF